MLGKWFRYGTFSCTAKSKMLELETMKPQTGSSDVYSTAITRTFTYI